MTIIEALDRYLVQLDADGRSHHTRNQYNRHIRLLAKWVLVNGVSGDIAAVRPDDVARFLSADMTKSRAYGGEKKPSAMNALRSTIRTFFTWLHAAGLIQENPARLVRRAVCADGPPRAMTTDEEGRFTATLSSGSGSACERDHALFFTMLRTGIRLGSALGLDVEDVDIASGDIELRHVKGGGGRTERVFFGDGIRDLLHGFVADRTTGPLFTSRSGGRLSHRHAQRRFAHWCKESGVRRLLTPHSLRHSFANALYRRSGDLLLVKEALLHRSINSTMVYARCDEARVRAAVTA